MRCSLLTLLGLVPLLGCGGSRAAPDDAPPVLRRAECRWTAGPLTIDGKLDEPAWRQAQVLQDFVVFWQNRKPRTATRAYLLWDELYLWFGADMDDADLFADVTVRNEKTWEDDVFELFFKPARDRLTYYELQVNARNTHLELFLPSRGAGGYRRFGPLTKFGMESAVQLRGTLNRWQDTDAGWTVEGRIPWTAFEPSGGRPAPGALWHFALCRFDYSIAFDRPELSSTAPLTQADFHRYEDYGELLFVKPK